MIDRSLLNLLPPLRRARGDRLYGPDQRHWVDLWKQDGAWLLGHRPEGSAREWKNQLDKGLTAWAPSAWPRRLESLAQQLFPGASVRLFRNADRAPASDPWRPWWQDSGHSPLVLGRPTRLVLPSGPAQAVAVVWPGAGDADLPDHDVVSPAEAAAVVQALAQVLRFHKDPQALAARNAMALQFDRFVAPSGLFQRQGLWFSPVDQARYSAVFRAHVDAGFFLNPDPGAPSVLPLALSPGEWAAWKAVTVALGAG